MWNRYFREYVPKGILGYDRISIGISDVGKLTLMISRNDKGEERDEDKRGDIKLGVFLLFLFFPFFHGLVRQRREWSSHLEN